MSRGVPQEVFERVNPRDFISPKNQETPHDTLVDSSTEKKHHHVADSEAYRQKVETHRRTTREAAEKNRQTGIQEVRQTIEKTNTEPRGPIDHLQSAEEEAVRKKAKNKVDIGAFCIHINSGNYGVDIRPDGTIEERPGLKQKMIRLMQGKNPAWKAGFDNVLRTRDNLTRELQTILEKKNQKTFIQDTKIREGYSSTPAIEPDLFDRPVIRLDNEGGTNDTPRENQREFSPALAKLDKMIDTITPLHGEQEGEFVGEAVEFLKNVTDSELDNLMTERSSTEKGRLRNGDRIAILLVKEQIRRRDERLLQERTQNESVLRTIRTVNKKGEARKKVADTDIEKVRITRKISEIKKVNEPQAIGDQKNDRPFVPVEHTAPEVGISSDEVIGPGQEIPFEEEADIVETERTEGLKQEFVFAQREIEDKEKKMEEFSNLEAGETKEEKIQRVKQEIQTLEQYKKTIDLDKKTTQSLAEKIHSTQSSIESFIPKFSGLSAKNQVENLQKIEKDSGGAADLTPLLTRLSIEKVSNLREEERQDLLLKVRQAQQDMVRRQAMRRDLFQSGTRETKKGQQVKKILDQLFEQLSNQKIESNLQYTDRLSDAETRPLRQKEIEEFKKASLDGQISQIRKMKGLYPKRDFTPLLTSDITIENKTNFGSKPILEQISLLDQFIKEFPQRQKALKRLVQSINTEQLQEDIQDLSSEEFEIMENVCRMVQTPETGRSPSGISKEKIDKVSSMMAEEEIRRQQIAA